MPYCTMILHYHREATRDERNKHGHEYKSYKNHDGGEFGILRHLIKVCVEIITSMVALYRATTILNKTLKSKSSKVYET